MTETIIIESQGDHVLQWVAYKRIYVARRGSHEGKSGSAIPLTTNKDIAALTKYWDTEFRHELMRNPFANDRSPSSMKHWKESKDAINKQQASADKDALFPNNEWFWDTATRRLAIYLESRKAIPSRTELLIDSVTETVQDHAQAAKKLARDAADTVTGAGKDLISTLKTGALILGGLVGASIIVPPIIRAFRD